MPFEKYPVNDVSPIVLSDVDAVAIGEALRNLIVDNFSGNCFVIFSNDAEELKRWPLRRMKVAREVIIADNYCE
jgi:hypothetical protein